MHAPFSMRRMFTGSRNGKDGIRITRDGTRFLDDPGPFRQITEVSEYWMEDILPDDAVLDIGANAGAFCIRAACRSRHVVAVEPVTWDQLERNIRLNEVEIPVIRAGIGNGKPAMIRWDGCSCQVPTYSLAELIHMARGCDFLKCDCEGAEWLINPADLHHVRRIEMELHQPPIGGHPAPALLDYICRNYEFVLDRTPSHGPLGLMGVLHAWRPATWGNPLSETD